MSQVRAQTTRNAVLAAAARVFERTGFAGSSIADILEESGVTKGALYFHFASKEALAAAIIEQQADWRESNVQPSPYHLQRLIDLSFRFVGALQADPLVRASIRLTLERNTFVTDDASPYEGWLDAVHGHLLSAQAADELRSDVDPLDAAKVLVAAITGVQLVSEATTGRADVQDRVGRLWTYFLPGLATPKIRRLLDLHNSVSVVAPA